MPRKTAVDDVRALQARLASMRPRPDAAENARCAIQPAAPSKLQ